jgi:hypothetical protein
MSQIIERLCVPIQLPLKSAARRVRMLPHPGLAYQAIDLGLEIFTIKGELKGIRLPGRDVGCDTTVNI